VRTPEEPNMEPAVVLRCDAEAVRIEATAAEADNTGNRNKATAAAAVEDGPGVRKHCWPTQPPDHLRGPSIDASSLAVMQHQTKAYERVHRRAPRYQRSRFQEEPRKVQKYYLPGTSQLTLATHPSPCGQARVLPVAQYRRYLRGVCRHPR